MILAFSNPAVSFLAINVGRDSSAVTGNEDAKAAPDSRSLHLPQLTFTFTGLMPAVACNESMGLLAGCKPHRRFVRTGTLLFANAPSMSVAGRCELL
jgi:hypothetical protein